MMTTTCDVCEVEAPAVPRFTIEAWAVPDPWTTRSRLTDGKLFVACPNPECAKKLDARIREGAISAIHPVHEIAIRATYEIGAADPPEKIAVLVVVAGAGAGEALGKKMQPYAGKLAGHSVSLNMTARARYAVPVRPNGGTV